MIQKYRLQFSDCFSSIIYLFSFFRSLTRLSRGKNSQFVCRRFTLQVDAAPFRAWYQTHYGVTLGKKKGKAKDAAEEDVKKSKKVEKKLKKRCKDRELDAGLKDVCFLSFPLSFFIVELFPHMIQISVFVSRGTNKGIPRFRTAIDTQ